MSLIRPFRALRPLPAYTEAVLAPPYDVLNVEEARARAAGKSYSFLHISRPEIDLPQTTDPYSAEVYAKGLENLRIMLKQGVLQQDKQACYYLYTLVMGQHTQTGLVLAASVAEYDTNRIRKHEFTRPDKEDDRVRQIETLRAQTGPVLLTHRDNSEVNRVIEKAMHLPALFEITAEDGVIHKLRIIDEPNDLNTLTTAFDAMPAIYIADGHHRSAAASRVAAMYRQQNPQHTGEEAYNYFLAVSFPDSQVKIFDYNRVVKDLNGLNCEELIRQLQAHFSVTASAQAVKPEQRGEIGMYLSGQWYRLTVHPERIPSDDPVAALDISLLTRYVITPLLGIEDQRRDKRIDFVGGIRGLEGLEKRVNSGEMAVAFAMYPTSLAELMAVADANQVMPPKSTWFEPKLADGLVSQVLEGFGMWE